jgi:uncharacterized protein (TIGR02996 family)
MTDRAAFLRAICERPHDDAPRLVYADWLDEHGDPRGEFIRLQIDLARLPAAASHRAALAQRGVQLLDDHKSAWEAELPPHYRQVVGYERGFPVVELSLADGRAFLDAYRASALSDLVPGYHLRLWEVRPAELDELALSPGLARLTGLACQPDGWRRGVLPRLLSSPYLTNLSELRLAGHAGAESVRALAAAAHLTRLRTLDLRGSRLTNDDVERLAGVAGLDNLSALWLGDGEDDQNFLGPAGARALAESPCFANVAELQLCRNPLGDEGGVELAAADWPRLADLHLSRCRLGPESAAALIGAPGLAGLRGLDLAGNDLGDVGAAALALSPALGRLRTLDLSDNAIGEDGAVALLTSPYLDYVSELRLDGNRGVARVERHFRRRFGARFQCRVFGYL